MAAGAVVPLAAVEASRDRWPVPVYFEGFPNCVLGRPEVEPMSRSGFGETHYLEDLGGRVLYAMRHVEASLSVHADLCRECAALPHCTGVAKAYAARYGFGELEPFSAGDSP